MLVRYWIQVFLRIPVLSNLEAVFIVSPKRQYLGIVRPTTPATALPKYSKNLSIDMVHMVILNNNLCEVSHLPECKPILMRNGTSGK